VESLHRISNNLSQQAGIKTLLTNVGTAKAVESGGTDEVMRGRLSK